MNCVILLFGVLIMMAGAMIIIKPDIIFGYIRNNSETLSLHFTAVAVRLVLGAALITYASSSRFPLALEIIGWLSISAAIILVVIGRTSFIRFITWALKFFSPLTGRVGGVFALLFGGFLVYASL